MIIRSQDKYSTTDSLELRIVKRRPPTNDEYRGEDIYTASGVFLGHYSTEEKAIKVLDMIAKKYARYQCLKASGRVYEEDAICQMPSDEEVEV